MPRMPSGRARWLLALVAGSLLLLACTQQKLQQHVDDRVPQLLLRNQRDSGGVSAGNRFLCVVTRVRNDFVNLGDFLPHYLEEGADLILVIDDRSDPPVVVNHPQVLVKRQSNDLNGTAGGSGYMVVQNAVKSHLMGCTWVISVDVDEFVTTRRNFRATVRDMLETFFRNTDVIYVPWVMYGFEYNQTASSSGGVRLGMRRRWNHSHRYRSLSSKGRSRHAKIEVKPIFRPSMLDPTGFFQSIHVVRAKADAVQVNGATGLPKRGRRRELYHFGEADIASAHLVTHHYRFHSIGQIEHKCLQPSRAAGDQAGHMSLVQELDVKIESLPWDHPQNVKRCIHCLNASNHIDILDDSLARKARSRGGGSWRRDLLVQATAPVALLN